MTSTGYPLSPCDTLVTPTPAEVKADAEFAPTPAALSPARKYALLLLFCAAQAVDVFNNSALFSAIPRLKEDMGMTESDATWLISAYQLTFASFLLIAGKISDVYDPKKAFVGGLAVLGVISLGAGFINSKIPLIILRALGGIFAAQTIPSALSLLVAVFPDPDEQARAIGVFGGCGAVANVGGLLIGALFVQLASWRWVFWFASLIALPVAGLVALLAPTQVPTPERAAAPREKVRRLDLPGVALVTAGLLLFIFGVTEGSTVGWTSAEVLAPLIVAVVLLLPAFFLYERAVPAQYAAVPPRTWFYPNFAVLFGAALFPYFWWTTVFTIFTVLWQQVYGWSAISTAVHMLPIGVLAFGVSFSGPLSARISPKFLILGGQALVLVATVLLAFADAPSKYWPFAFPAFCLGTMGAMLAYTTNNVAIFRSTPAAEAGTVGALFNGALQLGSAVGIAAVTSIEASVEARTADGFLRFNGRRAVFWFVLAVVVLETIAVAVFYRTDRAVPDADAEEPASSAESTSEKTSGIEEDRLSARAEVV